jgi:hypothetical protein
MSKHPDADGVSAAGLVREKFQAKVWASDGWTTESICRAAGISEGARMDRGLTWL